VGWWADELMSDCRDLPPLADAGRAGPRPEARREPRAALRAARLMKQEMNSAMQPEDRKTGRRKGAPAVLQQTFKRL
jgi:hypothetical protein